MPFPSSENPWTSEKHDEFGAGQVSGFPFVARGKPAEFPEMKIARVTRLQVGSYRQRGYVALTFPNVSDTFCGRDANNAIVDPARQSATFICLAC